MCKALEIVVWTVLIAYVYSVPQSENIYPSSCTQATLSARRSGVYGLRNELYGPSPFKVYCDEDVYGGGWTVVLRRKDGLINFYRGWKDYKHGFGNLEGEFFIGLDKLYALTNGPETQEVIFVLEDFKNVKKYAKYESFAISDESDNYTLISVGNYSGDAGDAFTMHADNPFQTFDHEEEHKKCASTYTGAWWYYSCYLSNLCGQYLNGAYSKNQSGQGIVWLGFHTINYSLKFAQMMIRPRR